MTDIQYIRDLPHCPCGCVPTGAKPPRGDSLAPMWSISCPSCDRSVVAPSLNNALYAWRDHVVEAMR